MGNTMIDVKKYKPCHSYGRLSPATVLTGQQWAGSELTQQLVEQPTNSSQVAAGPTML